MSERIQRAPGPIDIDGRLDKEAWSGVERSPRFGDIATGRRRTLFDTRAALMWDAENLYAAFWLEDRDVCSSGEPPRPWGWQENCVEILVAGSDAHCRVAVNPRGGAAAAFFIFKDAYRRGGRYDVPEFDLARQRPSVSGGDGGPHHRRGMRWCFSPWEIPGLRAGVQVEGTLDDRSDIDRGWTAEIALPWEGLKWLAQEGATSLERGDVWRMILLRRQLVDQRASVRQANWTWHPPRDGDLNTPEGYMEYELV